MRSVSPNLFCLKKFYRTAILKNTPGTRTKRVPGVSSLFPEELFYELLLESFDLGICIIAFGSEVELDLRLGT